MPDTVNVNGLLLRNTLYTNAVCFRNVRVNLSRSSPDHRPVKFPFVILNPPNT